MSESLIRTPDFTGITNLEYLDLENCTNLEEIHYSLGFCKKLVELNLNLCSRVWSFPLVNGESLELMDLQYCYRLGKLPENLGRMKPELVIHSTCCGIRELPSSLQYPTHLTELDLSGMENIEVLPSSICKLKCLVKLDVSDCYTLESLSEEIGDLENLEKLDATSTLISRPPPSIVPLNKLKSLKFVKEKTEDEVYFVFPPANDGLRSLEVLKLGSSTFIDGRIPEDIGCLSSLKELHLEGDNFEHLPQSIAQLDALRFLHLTIAGGLHSCQNFHHN